MRFPLSDFRLFLQYALRHKYSYLLGIAAIFATNWLAVNIPVHIGLSIDLLNDAIADNMSELYSHIYLVVGFAVIMIATRTLSRMCFFNPGRDVERELKNDSFAKLSLLQKDFYDRNQSGGLISIVNNDVSGVRAMAGVGMMQAFNIVFALSLTPMKMWQISPSLTLFCLIPILISFFIVTYAIKYFRKLVRTRMLYLQQLSSNTINFLNGVEVIKSHHVQRWAMQEFNDDNQNLLDCSLKQLQIQTFFMPMLQYTEIFLKILVLAVGGVYLIRQEISLGDLTAFLAYTALLSLPFISLGRIIATFQMGIVSLRSIGRILNTPSEDHADLEPESRTALFSAGISIKNLNYLYPVKDNSSDSELALTDVSLDIAPGEKVAILGKVGSGKTTLINCINRYLDVDPGQIMIDGIDITSISRKDLRSAVRTVTQDPFLFSNTIAYNVSFGATESDQTLSMDEVLYQSDMFDEVRQFPLAEQTLVGEKGIMLSGGQKQRLCLARAMYTPCKLLILDNVLSAVDNETERFLLDQIFNNTRSQSSIIISHRPAVMERVDRIILLDKGEIVAQGSHQHLLANSSRYRSTWEILQQGSNQQTVSIVQHDSADGTQ
ncbi:MAG: ATP-binding cassette subfamily B multidrug efflux pump [Chitinophagales bacterium]|jgi:ATP-binding cassette subfamily B multidrug efflux pump